MDAKGLIEKGDAPDSIELTEKQLNLSYADRILGHLRLYSLRYPGIWQDYDFFRSLRGQVLRGKKIPIWPNWCFCPLACSYYAISSYHNGSKLNLSQMNDVACVGALAAWRMTKSIYEFDEYLFDALINTDFPDKLPVDLLYHLPEWCIYIATPKLLFKGVFVHLEYGYESINSELRFVFDGLDKMTPFILYLDNSITFKENITRVFNNSNYKGDGVHSLDECITSWSYYLSCVISLVLYLCSSEPDIDGKPANPIPVKVKRGTRLFPKSGVRTWNVGARIGSVLRQDYLRADTDQPDHTDIGRVRPRAHVRLAHWHTYLTGHKRVNRVLKWLHPVLINGDVSQLPVIVRPVQEKANDEKK